MSWLQQGWMEQGYFREVEIPFPGCGPDLTATAATLLDYAVAAGGWEYDARSLPYELLRVQGQAFLLSGVSLRLHRAPDLREKLRVITWEAGFQGVRVLRNTIMEDEAGTLCASAKSQWILVNPESRRILRPESFTLREIPQSGPEVDCPPCHKIPLPQDSLDLGERRVLWSDLDGNRHLYSGNYARYFWDALPPELQTRPWTALAVNYHKEAILGETLHLRGHWAEGVFSMAGQGRDGLCFTADCHFAP